MTWALDRSFAAALGRAHGVVCGRGTTALWLALRAIERRDGPGEVILPDWLCPVALDGVLLAGFTPVFADVIPQRYTLAPDSVARLITPRTRAILVAHLFGHVADMDQIRQAAPGIPILEDAVQGFGGSFNGQPVGSLGDLSFISFDRYKMIGGRGGVLFFDDDTLLDGVLADAASLTSPLNPLSNRVGEGTLTAGALDSLLPPDRAAAYASQLRALAAVLLRSFDPSPANTDRIRADWETLPARIAVRNAAARGLESALSGLPLRLPELRDGDALWCYTVGVPGLALARRIMHDLHRAGLAASELYTPLSQFFAPDSGAGQRDYSPVNLWINETSRPDDLPRAAAITAAAVKLVSFQEDTR